MLACYPHVPLTEGLGLGIALMSYDGTLYWGLNADYEMMPDLPAFTAALRSSFKVLSKLAEEAIAIRKQSEEERPAPPSRRVRRPPPPKPTATRRGSARSRANGAARRI
jgi:hypothetical protein